jgi:hypothetical protein
MAYTRTDDVDASKEADRLRKRLPAAPDKRATFLAEELGRDKDVAGAAIQQVIENPSPVSRRIEAVVAEREAARRKRAAETARRKAEREAIPLPAMMATLVVKMDEWAIALQALTDDALDELPEGYQLELVGQAAQHLANQAQRIADRCRLAAESDALGEVIEGEFARR